MAQHAFRCEYDQRFAPVSQSLAAEKVKILCGVGWLRDLNVMFRGQLQEAFDASAGVFRSLAFVAVGQEQDDAGKQVPLGFTGGDDLVDNALGGITEVAELGLPKKE